MDFRAGEYANGVTSILFRVDPAMSDPASFFEQHILDLSPLRCS